MRVEQGLVQNARQWQAWLKEKDVAWLFEANKQVGPMVFPSYVVVSCDDEHASIEVQYLDPYELLSPMHMIRFRCENNADWTRYRGTLTKDVRKLGLEPIHQNEPDQFPCVVVSFRIGSRILHQQVVYDDLKPTRLAYAIVTMQRYLTDSGQDREAPLLKAGEQVFLDYDLAQARLEQVGERVAVVREKRVVGSTWNVIALVQLMHGGSSIEANEDGTARLLEACPYYVEGGA